MTLQELAVLYPPSLRSNAVVGPIPMEFVEANLDELKQLVRTERLRRFYRGPRSNRYGSDTRRSKAVAMVLYRI